jgi:septum formation protein
MYRPAFILASASPRRTELLRQLWNDFDVIAAEVNELTGGGMTAAALSQLNAYRKARAIAKEYPDAIVLGADTIVCMGEKQFGKPADLNEAFYMLGALQGHQHEVITGVCLLHLREHRQRMFSVSTVVRFRSLRTAQIREYFARVNPLDKAGAYGIQEQGDMIIEEISGSFSNVVGLPLERLAEELATWGLDIEWEHAK